MRNKWIEGNIITDVDLLNTRDATNGRKRINFKVAENLWQWDNVEKAKVEKTKFWYVTLFKDDNFIERWGSLLKKGQLVELTGDKNAEIVEKSEWNGNVNINFSFTANDISFKVKPPAKKQEYSIQEDVKVIADEEGDFSDLSFEEEQTPEEELPFDDAFE